MDVKFLLLLTVLLLAVLAGGAAYLVLRRMKKSMKTDADRLARVSDELMEKIASRDLSERQKEEIAEALRQIRRDHLH